MQHASEGELHAYLDGALDLFPEDEAERIRSHLGTCADCAARLEQEASLRAGASAILAHATPGDVAAPPLEELRRRAATGGSAGAGSAGPLIPKRVAWAWAATVVLALGIGWGVGGYRVGTGSSSARSAPAAEMSADAGPVGAAPAEPAPSTAGGTAPEQRALARAEVAADQDVAAARVAEGDLEKAAPAEPQAAERSALLDAPADRAAAGERDAADEALALAAGADTEADSGAPATTAEERLALDEIVVTGEAAVARRREPLSPVIAPPVAPAERAAVRQEREVAAAPPAASPPPPSTGQARARVDASDPTRESFASPAPAAVSPAIPDLVVVRVDSSETAGQPSVRVLQRRADGVQIELRFVGVQPEELEASGTGGRVGNASAERAASSDLVLAPAAPPALADSLMTEPLPAGWSQVVVSFRGGWVVVRGPLAEAELRTLAGRIR